MLLGITFARDGWREKVDKKSRKIGGQGTQRSGYVAILYLNILITVTGERVV